MSISHSRRPAGAASSAVTVAMMAFAPLVLGACGARTAHPAGTEELLSSLPARSAACVVDARPEALPAVDAVVDSTMLAASVRELGELQPAPSGHVLLTLGFTADGMNIRRDIIERSARPVIADSIQRLVFAARRQVEETEQEWGVRLRIDFNDPAEMRIGRRELCPPRPRDPRLEQAIFDERAGAPLRIRRGIRERRVMVRLVIGTLGTVEGGRVLRGVEAGSTVERDLVLYLRQFLFEPARIDGEAIRGTIDVPVRVRG